MLRRKKSEDNQVTTPIVASVNAVKTGEMLHVLDENGLMTLLPLIKGRQLTVFSDVYDDTLEGAELTEGYQQGIEVDVQFIGSNGASLYLDEYAKLRTVIGVPSDTADFVHAKYLYFSPYILQFRKEEANSGGINADFNGIITGYLYWYNNNLYVHLEIVGLDCTENIKAIQFSSVNFDSEY